MTSILATIVIGALGWLTFMFFIAPVLGVAALIKTKKDEREDHG